MVTRRGFLGSVAGCAVAAVVPLGAFVSTVPSFWADVFYGDGGSSVPGAFRGLTLADYAVKHSGDFHHAALVEDLTARSDILLGLPWREDPA